MNEHEPHPTKKPDLDALRAKVRAWLDAKAARRTVLPPSHPPRYDKIFFLVTTWLDRLSYTDDWSDCFPDSGAAPREDEG